MVSFWDGTNILALVETAAQRCVYSFTVCKICLQDLFCFLCLLLSLDEDNVLYLKEEHKNTQKTGVNEK